jgi:hypothetical protein
MAKLARERLVQERRALKREKKQAAAEVRELRRFLAEHEELEVEPGSELDLKLDAARRTLAARDGTSED